MSMAFSSTGEGPGMGVHFHFAASTPSVNVVVGSVTPLEVVPVNVNVLSTCKNAAR
jgi:hypothetical protein